MASRERTTISVSTYFEGHRKVLVPSAKEIAVERMRSAFGINRKRSSSERLSSNLASVERGPPWFNIDSSVEVLVELFQSEDLKEI